MPPSQPPKTYILPPAFDQQGSSSSTVSLLGALLSDPFAPHRPLATLPPESHPPTSTSTQLKLSLTRSTTHSVSASFSLSAQLLELAALKTASNLSFSSTRTYSAPRVTTYFFERDPDEDAVRALISSNPRAGKVLSSGRFPGAGGGGKLYMVTAVKVADGGFTVSTERVTSKDVSVGGDLPVGAVAGGLPVGVSMGAEAGGSRASSETDEYTVEGEVVIAYRVVVIRMKRRWLWRRGGKEEDLGGLDLDEFRSGDRERMLGDGDDDDDDDDDSDGGGVDKCEDGEVEAVDVAVEDLGCENDDNEEEEEEEETNARRLVLESDEGEVVVLGTVGGLVR
ncbi:hypothetical protein V8F06_014487 [Rhypophila decipiens]